MTVGFIGVNHLCHFLGVFIEALEQYKSINKYYHFNRFDILTELYVTHSFRDHGKVLFLYVINNAIMQI